MSQSSSVLFGLDGVIVEAVQIHPDGTRTVRVVTAPQWVGVCPVCTTTSTHSKGWVTTRPRDIKIGRDRPRSNERNGNGCAVIIPVTAGHSRSRYRRSRLGPG